MLFNSFSYPAEQGQIVSQEVMERTVIIPTGNIEITDFSSPNLDEQRGKGKAIESEKVILTNNARILTKEAFK